MALEDREKIEAWRGENVRSFDIAQRIGVNPTTIYRELHRGYTGELDKLGRPIYSARIGQETFRENLRRRRHRQELQD